MSDSVDIFSDLLSGLKPTTPVNVPEEAEPQPIKSPSMQAVRSALQREQEGDKVHVHRSNSPIGIGLAPPPPPLSREEMTELFSEVLRENLFESMKALTGTLHTCLQSMNDRISALDEKMNTFNLSLEELQKCQSVSKSSTEKALSDMSQSVRETGIGMQRVIDKQELVDAHLLLSKLQKETVRAKEEVRQSVGSEQPAKTSSKNKDTGDAGGHAEPNPPSPAPHVSAPQVKQDAQNDNTPKSMEYTGPSPLPSVSAPQPQAGWQPPANNNASHGHGLAHPRVTLPSGMPGGHPSPGDPQDSHQVYNSGQDARKDIPPQYEGLTRPAPPQHVHPPAPVLQQQPHSCFPPVYSQQQSTPMQRQEQPPQQAPPLMPSFPQPQPPPQAPPQGPHPVQWQPAPPHPPAHHPPTPPQNPHPPGQYGQMAPFPPPQMQPYPNLGGNAQPPPPGAYPNIAQLPPRQGQPAPMPPQAPPPAPIYGAPPPIMTSQSSKMQGDSSGTRSSSQSMPLDQVIDDVTAMGFERTKVRSIVTDMINQGKSVDLNVVIDRLMKSAGY